MTEIRQSSFYNNREKNSSMPSLAASSLMVLSEVDNNNESNTAAPSGLSICSMTDSNIDINDSSKHASNATLLSRSSYYYLSPKAVSRLPHYQYQGADLSLLYKHVLSPLAAWLVDHCTPVWLAPNAITLVGLGWMVLSYSVIWWFCPGLYEANTTERPSYSTDNINDSSTSNNVPPWIFLLNCVAMIIYQTLDNMDGKQARKTGSSSPLGLLFDHGCDAINMIFGSGNWIAAMGLYPGKMIMTDSDSIRSGSAGDENLYNTNYYLVSNLFGGDATLATLLILCPMIAFYISTWEQFYTGKLVLPPFNGPSEGLLLGASLSFVSWYCGVNFWHKTGVVDYAIDGIQNMFLWGADAHSRLSPLLEIIRGRVRNLDLIVLSSVVALIQEVTLKTIFVVRSYGGTTLRTIMPHFLFVVSTLVLVSYDETILLRIPRTVMHLISGIFVEHTTQLMLDHMVEEEFKVLKRFSLYPIVALAAAMVACDGNSRGILSVEALDAFLLAYTTGLWVYLAFKIRVLIYEICDVLGIWCFDIMTPYECGKEKEQEYSASDIVNSTVTVDYMMKKVN